MKAKLLLDYSPYHEVAIIDNYLYDYEKLCRKHSMIIGACSCCNSPWVKRATSYLDYQGNVICDVSTDIDRHITHLNKADLGD